MRRVRLIGGLGNCANLQQLAKLLDCEPSITNDTAESEGVDRIMPWDRKYSRAIGHNDVLALAGDGETGLFQGREPPRDG